MTSNALKWYAIMIIMIIATYCSAQTLPTTDTSQPITLQVGVKEAPPFAIKDADGKWTGISIYLWKELAKSLGYHYEFVEYSLEELLTNVSEHKLDAGIAAITISKEREELFDFSLPYFTTGLSILTHKEESNFLDVVQRLFSFQFFQVIMALIGLLLLIGGLLWLVERKGNEEQFGGKWWKGIGAAFWWSAVTMTTVGYGDKAPVTFLGRIIGFIWMFSGLIIISGFTAAVTSALTIDQLTTVISGPEDLDNVKVATVTGSSSASYLQRREINYFGADSIEEAVQALEARKVDAVVYDAPILQYLMRQGAAEEVELLPDVFLPFHYGIALPESSPRKEEINVKLLEIISQPEWKSILFQYLGSSDH
ncbi:MAG: transporter substrate-binding domain-containing protein [Aureispira sp.]